MSDDLRLPDTVHTIPEALAFWAEWTPDAPALRAIDGQELSHRELQYAVFRVATRLSALGVQREDRIAMTLHGGPETGITLLGTMATAVAAPLSPAMTARELTHNLERLRPRLLVTGILADVASRMVARDLDIATIAVDDIIGADGQRSAPDPRLPCIDPDSIAAILHTSGTTGTPKRIPVTHRSLVAAAQAAHQCWNLTREDVELLVAGFHTIAGLVQMCAALMNGGACVAAPHFDPVEYPRWLSDYRLTWTAMAPTEMRLLLEAATTGIETLVGPESRLRFVIATGQAMAPEEATRAEQILRAPVLQGYGMSEAAFIAWCGPMAADRREGSCGRPLTAVRIVDEAGGDAQPGASGEIVIRGPTLFSGYLKDPESNRAAFLPGGWFRTGDIGYLDDDGFLYLNGRVNELINRGGEKISPIEVDHALMNHPAVADAATFAMADPLFGEDIVAAVVLDSRITATPRELRSWMLDRLSAYKVPRRIWFVNDLPRTPTGKVKRGVLADRFLNEALERCAGE